jgi:hypothetical protein
MTPAFLSELKKRGYRVVHLVAGPGNNPSVPAPAGWVSETGRVTGALKPRLDKSAPRRRPGRSRSSRRRWSRSGAPAPAASAKRSETKRNGSEAWSFAFDGFWPQNATAAQAAISPFAGISKAWGVFRFAARVAFAAACRSFDGRRIIREILVSRKTMPSPRKWGPNSSAAATAGRLWIVRGDDDLGVR